MTSQPLPERDSAASEDPKWMLPLEALQQALLEAANAVAEFRVSLEATQPAPADRNDDATRLVADPARYTVEDGEPGSVPRELRPSDPKPSAQDATALAPPVALDTADEPVPAAPYVPLAWPPPSSTVSEPASEGVPQEQLTMPDQLSGEQEEELLPEKTERLTDFQRVWARIEGQRIEQDKQAAADPAPEAGEAGDGARGLNLLPKEYVITVEDGDASVDLITIERALLTLAKMEDVTLISYAKGVPVIAVRVEGELDLTALGNAVGSAMAKRCEVIPQEKGKVFLRLTAPANEEPEA